MVEAVFRAIFGTLFAILCWLVLIPIGVVLATPVVLFLVLCRHQGTFRENLMEEYRQLWKFWKEVGFLMMPPW
jgi:hypothetical protein